MHAAYSEGNREATIATLVGMVQRRRTKRKLAEGYSEGPDGRLVPPGWRMMRDVPQLPPPARERGGD